MSKCKHANVLVTAIDKDNDYTWVVTCDDCKYKRNFEQSYMFPKWLRLRISELLSKGRIK